CRAKADGQQRYSFLAASDGFAAETRLKSVIRRYSERRQKNRKRNPVEHSSCPRFSRCSNLPRVRVIRSLRIPPATLFLRMFSAKTQDCQRTFARLRR